MTVFVGQRWSLAQAIAWVATRDEQLLGQEGLNSIPMTETMLVVMIVEHSRDPKRTGLGTSGAWRELAGEIAEGAIAADGEPGQEFNERGQRQALGGLASGLHIEDGGLEGFEGLFLAGATPGQERWFNVEFSAADLRRANPNSDAQGKRRGGRPTKYDYEKLKAETFRILDFYGTPNAKYDDLPSHRALIKKLQSFSSEEWKIEPSVSLLQPRVKAWLEEFIAANKN